MRKARLSSAGFFAAVVLLLLLHFGTRVYQLEALPLHNDEGLHLTRALEVWNSNPFWEIRDGKIINHWLIAAFYPQHAPVFAGRIATVFVALLGLAATLAWARRARVGLAALPGALLWVASPFLLFYERMAFADAQAGALGLVAMLAAVHIGRHWRWPLLAGGALALALLFKFTAAPFALSVALLVMTLRIPLRQRLSALASIAALVALAFVVPVAVLLSRGDSLFDIALAWIGAGGGGSLTLFDNLGRFAALLSWGGFWGAGTVLGIAGAALLGRREQRLFLLAAALPLLSILAIGRDAQSRHFTAALPPLLASAGVGVGLVIQRAGSATSMRRAWQALGAAASALAVGAVLVLAFQMRAFWSRTGVLDLPPLMAQQYIEGYASGYGLRDAVEAFAHTLTNDRLAVVGSMYPDSCRRANFYAPDRPLLCGDAPMRDAVEMALARDGAVYVLVEREGVIGLDVATLDARAVLLGTYPRPHETSQSASVRLYRLER